MHEGGRKSLKISRSGLPVRGAENFRWFLYLRGVEIFYKFRRGGTKFLSDLFEGGQKFFPKFYKNDHPPTEDLKMTNP